MTLFNHPVSLIEDTTEDGEAQGGKTCTVNRKELEASSTLSLWALSTACD